jgi:hypothetical protein
MRARCLAEVHPQGHVEMSQSIVDWAGELLSLPSVKSSVVEDFNEKYRHFLSQKGSWLLALGGRSTTLFGNQLVHNGEHFGVGAGETPAGQVFTVDTHGGNP